MKRTHLVIGSCSDVGEATVARIRNQGNQVIRIDARGGDINVDFSTTAGRLEAIEKVIEITSGEIDAIISTIYTDAKKPVALAANYFGITQFLEGLYDEIRKGSFPRISILNYYDESDVYSKELVDLMLHQGEKKTLDVAQKILENSPELSFQNYTSSQKALQLWVKEMAHKVHWADSGILMNIVTADKTIDPIDVAELLVWLASAENQSHTGEVFKAQSLTELRMTT